MENMKYNEWQQMSLKKDIEKISRRIAKQKTIGMVTIAEVAIATISMLLAFSGRFESDSRAQAFFLGISIALLIAVPLVPFVILGLSILRQKYIVYKDSPLLI